MQQFGEKRFCRNSPDVDFSSGYPGSGGRAGHRGIPIRDPDLARWWDGRMMSAAADLGVNGFWADSFQNMFMSQMNYQMADGAPHNRQWWEWIAAASRKGLGWMSESTSFPGLSCSIEVGDNPKDFEGVWWALPYTTRWYRGQDVPNKGTDKADRLFFRSMANKGPIAPGHGDVSQIPSYKAMSAQYMAALSAMRRPFQLPGDAGVLWLTNADDKTGVLFTFVDRELPTGVTAVEIGSRRVPTSSPLKAHNTYQVIADDLLPALGLLRGPEKDPRIGVKYEPPVRFMKKWSE